MGAVLGNVYGSENIIDLADVIAALQVSSGKSLAVNNDADVNNDGKIGLAEAVFALQVVSGTKEQPLFEQFQNVLDTSVAGSKIPGAVLLIRTPSLEWKGASGLADVSGQTPMKDTDMLRIASMTKVFVSTVVLRLSEEGKLALDDPIRDHLSYDDIVSRIRYEEGGPDITIRHLLSMTAGVLDYVAIDAYNDAVAQNPNRETAWTPREILEGYVFGVYDNDDDFNDFADQGDIFKAGTAFKYSNTNYLLLEMIVEKVSGSTLAAEMRRIIFDPLTIENTFMEIKEAREGGFGGLFVHGYQIDENTDELRDVTETNDALGLGDGGIISDAYGLADFLSALFKEKNLLRQASLDQMTRFDPYGHGSDYGLGLSFQNTDFGVAWGHNGTSSGFQGDMIYLPEKEIIFVLLTNCEDADIFDSVLKNSLNLLSD
ncbi:D-alanyl-D-alanine carboxypeptidase [Desulfonema ishimotonii]|uniref:D-alanyl-D-alanine carboxypeptidase n=1 Tax=Desulfonema ishimotonii TaxID=45657 RepID=A0A401FT62_9BACT|nr:serine hydrolase domain-containing protein [Desulfonema ishimotonii]GBC60146.1 D-alanyl-D-alanine carboxypeptidase [Desulfonema ishimotonii]